MGETNPGDIWFDVGHQPGSLFHALVDNLTEKAEPLINEMEEVIGKTRDEILSGVSKQEVETLLHLIRKLEQNILDLQAKD